MENLKNKIEIEKMMRYVFFLYCIFASLVLLLKGILAYINGEEVIETIMVTFRSYILGSISSDEKILSMKMENIGLYSIHLMVFFGFAFYYVFADRVGQKMKMAYFFMALLFGLILTIYMRDRFIFCLPESLIVFGVIILIAEIGKVKINTLFSRVFNGIFLILSVVGFICEFVPYFLD